MRNISILLILPSPLISHCITAFQTSWQLIGGHTPIIRQRSLYAQKNYCPSSVPEKFMSYRWKTIYILATNIWSWTIGFQPPLQSIQLQPFIPWQLKPGVAHLLNIPIPPMPIIPILAIGWINPPPPQPPQPPKPKQLVTYPLPTLLVQQNYKAQTYLLFHQEATMIVFLSGGHYGDIEQQIKISD